MMKRLETTLLAVLAMMMVTGNADADDGNTTDGQHLGSAFMRVYGQALPPIGHVGFCRRHPAECRAEQVGRKRFSLTTHRLQELQSVNSVVNRMIKPVTDLKLYGRLEHWTYPSEYGDCEDYVILKRRLLIQRGWPASALLITVVRDENNEGHAVLTARTDAGDYLLDNKRNDIMSWRESSYTFVKRQSYRDPGLWMSLTPGHARNAEKLSGTRSN